MNSKPDFLAGAVPAPQANENDEAAIERLLGDKALFSLDELQPMGGPSRPTLHRAVRARMI